jgi:hypothetical protein
MLRAARYECEGGYHGQTGVGGFHIRDPVFRGK